MPATSWPAAGWDPSPATTWRWLREPERIRARLREAQEEERASRRGAKSTFGRGFSALPAPLRGGIVLVSTLALLTFGVQWEGGAASMAFAARFALHAWILTVAVGALLVARKIREHWDHESFAFGVGLAAMLVLGRLTDGLL